MNRDLKDQLIKNYPLLYEDVHKDFFSCGDGWFYIIEDLSNKLELIIREWIKNNKNSDCICGCPRIGHIYDSKCISLYKAQFKLNLPYPMPKFRESLVSKFRRPKSWWRKLHYKLIVFINTRILYPLSIIGLIKNISCICPGYKTNHPKAILVKQEFNILEFYVSPYIPIVKTIINDAKNKSIVTCENCGRFNASISNNWWIRKECPKCKKIKNLS